MLVAFEKTPSEGAVMLVKKPNYAKINASVMDTTLHVTILLFHSLILHVEVEIADFTHHDDIRIMT